MQSVLEDNVQRVNDAGAGEGLVSVILRDRERESEDSLHITEDGLREKGVISVRNRLGQR